MMKNLIYAGFRHAAKAAITIILIAAGTLVSSAQVTLSGVVTDQSDGSPLPGAHVSLGNEQLTAVTSEDGSFLFRKVRKGVRELSVTYVGFNTVHLTLKLQHDTTVKVALQGSVLLGDEVNIVATRAQEKYPTAYASVTARDLRSLNLGKDIPYLIQQTPSVVVTSDAGNGIGYTSMNIRGTDLTRINVTVNGIPVNDAESQGVWFVDLPDLASSTSSIQIQRGVGTSTNGAGAFGASVNFMTTDMRQDAYGELDLTGGSYSTFKSTLRFGTGLLKNGLSVDGRLSFIRSDGYIDRASSNLKSYYLAGGYYGKRTTLRLITYSGLERTYQAWEGVPKDSLTTRRTYNPAGKYIDKDGNLTYYKDQVDNYQQDNYQAIFSNAPARNWILNVAMHYTKGSGYYENYKENASFSSYGLDDVIVGGDTLTSTNLVNRKYLDNDFFGVTYSVTWNQPDRLKLIAGGAWNRYHGRHSGKVIWAEYASNGDNDRNWYYSTGLKKDFNLFIKGTYQVIKQISLFADIQYRHVDHTLQGTLDNLRTMDQRHTFDFINPKGGIFFTAGDRHEAYFSFGVANREPSRNNFKDADPGETPTFETLFDYELGYTFKSRNFMAGANLYYMDYHDQLVLTGAINDVGEAIMVNVPNSYRTGIELSATINLFREILNWGLSGSFSRNKINDFTWYVDLYDADWNYTGQQATHLGTTNQSFSPQVTAMSIITVKPAPSLFLTLNSKYVGRQFIDNTSSHERSLDPYFINGIGVRYTFKTKLFDEIGFNLAMNNLFSVKYETNAWIYPYYQAGNYYEANGYFPQALMNVMIGVNLNL